VIQRGNNRAAIFTEAADYERFLADLGEACAGVALPVDGYVLMTNHLHLVVTPSSPDAIALTMQAVGRTYVRYFNSRHGRTGGLFEGRYHSFCVDTETYWFTCVRYVEMNPVRASLVARPEDYRWSSYRAHAYGAADPVLSPHVLYGALGQTAETRRAAWRALCAVPLRDDELARVRGVKGGQTPLEGSSNARWGLTPGSGGTGV
jgi:putative transposase